MSNKPLMFTCMIYPDPKPQSFLVAINNLLDTSVHELKAAIKTAESPNLDHIAASALTLWKVSIPEDNLEEESKNIDFGDGSVTELKMGSRKLFKYFPDPLPEEHIHVLVQAPAVSSDIERTRKRRRIDDPKQLDIVDQLTENCEICVREIATGPPPSHMCISSTSYNTFQGTKAAILDGRFNVRRNHQTAALPIQLYNRIFGAFCVRARNDNLTPPDDVLRGTAELLKSVSGINLTEAPRDAATRQILSQILGQSLDRVQNPDSTTADYMHTQPTPFDVNAAPMIAEVKPELGLRGDPSVQVSFSYARFHCLDGRSAIRKNSRCPSFIIGLAGPWLVIMGGVITSRIIVQRLSAYEWLGCSRLLEEEQVFHVARRLYALKLCLQELKKQYENLTVPPVVAGNIHPRFCPSITSFTDAAGAVVLFTYVAPLQLDISSCVVFRAIREDTNTPIVVKFARRYGKEAHEWMAGRGLAPNLIHYGGLGEYYDNLYLVVMDYVDGKTLYDLHGTRELPNDVKDGVQKALDVLGEGGFVFGDLRRPNIMLTDGREPVEKRMRFIDFDWAGKEGPDLRYPFFLSSVVREPAEARDYDLIEKVHQDRMFEDLCVGLNESMIL